MLQSMTGFAATSITLKIDDQTRTLLSMHIKTLNSRFFESTCRLPYALTTLETEIVKKLKKKLYRGAAYLTVQLDSSNAFKSPAKPSLPVIKGYLDAITTMQNEFKLKGEVTIAEILTLPDVFETSDKTVAPEIKEQIFAAIDQLIDTLIQERSQEGAMLEKDLVERMTILEKEIAAIEQLSGQALEQRTQEINKTLAQMIESNQAETLMEVKKSALYTQLDKMDIHEEIVRFKTHIKNMSTILAAPETEKGKRLDFTLQELMREANTITAKAPNATISSHAVTMKVELEKAREQVQNIV